MSENWNSRNCHSVKKHWEGIDARVLNSDVLNFHCVVAQEEVEGVCLLASIISVVIPHNSESKHFSVVGDVLFQFLIWLSSLKLYFKVLLGFCKIWGSLFDVEHHSGVEKVVI